MVLSLTQRKVDVFATRTAEITGHSRYAQICLSIPGTSYVFRGKKEQEGISYSVGEAFYLLPKNINAPATESSPNGGCWIKGDLCYKPHCLFLPAKLFFPLIYLYITLSHSIVFFGVFVMSVCVCVCVCVCANIFVVPGDT